MMCTRLPPLLCLLALMTSIGSLQAQTYKNTQAGFALTPPDKFVLTPVALQDKNTVAKWIAKTPIRDIPVEMMVMVFEKVAKKKPAAGTATADAASRPAYDDSSSGLTSYEKYSAS